VRNEKRDMWIQWLPGTVGTILVVFVAGLLVAAGRIPLPDLLSLLVGSVLIGALLSVVLTWLRLRRR
jgi:hypothetical protein